MSEENEEDPENESEVSVKEKEKKQVKAGDINLTISNQTSLDQEKVWDEIRTEIKKKYDELGIPFDPKQISTKEEMEHHVRVLKTIENAREEFKKENLNKQGSAHGMPLTGFQTGENEKPSGKDRDIQSLKESTRDIPLDLLEYNSVKEMKDLLDSIANDSNDPRQKEAERLRTKILASNVQKSQTLELDSSLKDACHNKAKWKKKGTGED